jgi:hypothetical protein
MSPQFTENAALRTLDAIPIAAAMDSECDLFVSADAQQCKAATELGLKVERIA